MRRNFTEQNDKRLSEPFRGIAASSGVESGLFAIRSTGVSTEPVRRAALAFLDALNAEQRKTTVFIHVVIRTPNGNDYGKGLLRRHYARHPH